MYMYVCVFCLCVCLMCAFVCFCVCVCVCINREALVSLDEVGRVWVSRQDEHVPLGPEADQRLERILSVEVLTGCAVGGVRAAAQRRILARSPHPVITLTPGGGPLRP
jgi:hypothetical protein